LFDGFGEPVSDLALFRDDLGLLAKPVLLIGKNEARERGDGDANGADPSGKAGRFSTKPPL
jgi:hypothetical protein